MPHNVFSVSGDSMLDFLSKRDAEQRLTEDRARRGQLDQQTQQNADRQYQLQRDQLSSIDQDRDERRATQKALADQKIHEDDEVSNLIKVVTDPNVEPRVREQAGLRLDALHVSPGAINNILNPKPKDDGTRPILEVGQDGKVHNLGSAPVGAHILREPKPTPDPNAPKPYRDNPLLPVGVKSWIDSIAQRGLPLSKAREELSAGWGAQRTAHPNAELGDASKYLMELYPLGEDPMSPRQRQPLAPEASKPGQRHSEAGAVPAPSASPAQRDDMRDAQELSMLQARAAAVLQSKGIEPSDANLEKFLSSPTNVQQLKRMPN